MEHNVENAFHNLLEVAVLGMTFSPDNEEKERARFIILASEGHPEQALILAPENDSQAHICILVLESCSRVLKPSTSHLEPALINIMKHVLVWLII